MRKIVLSLLFAAALFGQNPNTAVFPSHPATDTDLFVATNLAATTLSGAIAPGATSIGLTSGVGFTAPVVIVIDNEIFHCTLLSLNTLSSCTAGAEGTTQAAHSAGAAVKNVMTAWHHNQIAAEVKAVETRVASLSGNALTPVTTSTTPNFNRASANQEWAFTISTSNSTATTSGLQSSDILIFNITQCATAGGCTFTWPTGFSEACTIASGNVWTGIANLGIKQTFYWDGTNAHALTPCITTAAAPTDQVVTDAVNTFTSAGTVDLSASTVANALRAPVAAAATSTANGGLVYDATNNMLHASQSAADAFVPQFTATPANNDCAKWTVSGSNYKLNTFGGACTGVIFSGTAALGTGAITSGTCATVVTVSATGVATTDVVLASFNGDPTAVTGYIPTTAGMLTIIAYPTTNNINFKVCNNTASSITPGAITLNTKVVR